MFKPDRIILFGSYAYGTPIQDSDVDLLVILEGEPGGPRRAIDIRRELHAPFALDLLVRSKTDVEERLALNDFFLREIFDKGRVLYAADHK
jgi:predicted nucleotidyltransferase